MKTTLELPDALLEEAKTYASKRGIPFREVVEISLRSHLEAAQIKAKPFKLKPDKPWHGGKPLVDVSDWPTVRAIAYEGHGGE
jgi:hypothetical protein